MALTADEQKLLDELTVKASQADADEEFEIEIFDGGKGARIPFRHGRSWLESNFGISIGAPAPSGGGGQDGGAAGGDGGGGQGATPAAPPSPRSYFGGKGQAAGK